MTRTPADALLDAAIALAILLPLMLVSAWRYRRDEPEPCPIDACEGE